MAYRDPRIACTPYVTPDDLCCEGEGTTVDCDGAPSPSTHKWSDEDVIAAATNLLFQRTCYRYPGLCPTTVIPCVCHQLHCGCGGGEPTILLTSDYPIHEITEVKVDGVAIDGAKYRLDEHARLVRIDGERWPGDYRAIQITYTTGRVVPVELRMAAAELACELKKACEGDASCSLPSHVRSVSRRGVDYEVNDVIAMMSRGLTGNPIVDYAITTHGDCRRSTMFDPLRDKPANVRVG